MYFWGLWKPHTSRVDKGSNVPVSEFDSSVRISIWRFMFDSSEDISVYLDTLFWNSFRVVENISRYLDSRIHTAFSISNSLQ